MDGKDLHTFPSSPTEALAMLYLQQQDLRGKTPEEIQTMYYETYYALRRDYTAKRANNWFKTQNGLD